MKRKQNIRKTLPLLCLAGIMALTGCKKDPIVEYKDIYNYKPNDTVYIYGNDTVYIYNNDTVYNYIQKHDVTLNFTPDDWSQISPENIQRHLADSTVRNIYLNAVNGDYTHLETPDEIYAMQYTLRKDRIYLDPRDIYGAGNLVFRRGTLVAGDSVALAMWGWNVSSRPVPGKSVQPIQPQKMQTIKTAQP